MATIENLLNGKVEKLKNEIAAKQNELASAQNDLKKYEDNKATIDSILALQSGRKTRKTSGEPYTGKPRGRKKAE